MSFYDLTSQKDHFKPTYKISHQERIQELENQVQRLQNEVIFWKEKLLAVNSNSENEKKNMYVHSKSGEKSNTVDQNQLKTEMKVEVKEEPLYDLYTVHDNSKHIAKLSEVGENWQLKEESYFDEVCAEMGIDFVTSKTFDEEYLKTTKSQDGEKSPQSSDNSNSQDISAGETSKTNQHPETLEELLERQWEQGSQFLREGGRHFDSKFYHLTYHFLDNNTYIDSNKRALRSFGLTNF